jgi:hypothetical protein
MTVYVDSLEHGGFKIQDAPVMTCHLFADNDGPLHELARRIGVKESWFRNARSEMHLSCYEITEKSRTRAIELGAVEVDKDGLAVIAKRHRAAQSKTVQDIVKAYGLTVKALE